MSTTNPVFNVLTTSGNQAPLASGSRSTALQHGQIGVFNVHTGLSIDGTVAGDAKDIFIAIGINRTSGSGACEDIQQSAGPFIQAKHLKHYTFKGYNPEVQKVVEVTGFRTVSDATYALRIEFHNQKIYSLNGYNALVKSYTGQSAASFNGVITELPSGDVVRQIIEDINGDDDALIIAAAFAYQIKATVNTAPTADGTLTVTVGAETFSVPILDADTVTLVAGKIAAAINAVSGSAYAASSTGADLYVFPKVPVDTGSSTATVAIAAAGGTSVTINAITAANTTISDMDAFLVANPDASFGIRITGVAQTRPFGNNDINSTYYKNGTDFEVATVDFFGATPVTITQLRFAEGKGYDLKQLEYVAGGWNGKPGPYRQSLSTGLARTGFEFFISPTATYHQFVINAEFEAVGGWERYEHSIENIIAIPVADTTTLSGLVAILDAVFSQVQPMANDTTANDTEQVATSTLAAATDGIEILS